jgi:DNA-nicking Smr family endonuclease
MSAGGGSSNDGTGGDPLFRASMEDVTPLPSRGKVEPETRRPSPSGSRRLEAPNPPPDRFSDHVPWPLHPDAGAGFVRPGVKRQALRRLRRGYWKVAAELDLHGYTARHARAELAAFLDRARAAGAHCVRVIHGRGMRSPDREPVLKTRVAAWLAQHDGVLAYCEARPAEGGSGAVVVLLKGGERARP